MPIEITTPPVGLAGYLGSKKTGRNPAMLEDLVRGTIDLSQFYALGQELQLFTFTSTMPIAPTQVSVPTSSPPATFLRYWLALTVFSQGIGTIQPFIWDFRRAAFLIAGPVSVNPTGNADNMVSLATPQNPLLMPSWQAVGISVRAAAGPGVDPLNVYGWYFDIPV